MKGTRVLALAFSTILGAVSLAMAVQDDAAASMERAKRMYRSRDFAGAVQELTRTVEFDPTRADAYYLLGYSHTMLRNYPQAVEAFGRAFEADPTFDPRTIYQRPAEDRP